MLLEDGWSIVPDQYAASASYEHTILIKDEGAEVMSLPTKEFVRDLGV